MVGDVRQLTETPEGDVLGGLDDGTAVRFRRIRPDDKTLLKEGFALLSPESRYRRFFSAVDHLSERQLRYFTEVDFVDHFAWIAEIPDGMGLGVARWIRIKNEPTVAEGAVTVIDPFHGRGIGKALLWLGEVGAGPGRWTSGVLEVDIPLPADLDEFERSPIPEVFRATARGQLLAEAEPAGNRANVKHAGGFDGNADRQRQRDLRR